MIDKLWNEYFFEKCSTIDTEEEREILKRAVKFQKCLDELLTAEQNAAVERYVEVLHEMQMQSCKKAFFKGCEFALAFLSKSNGLGD